MKKFALLAGLFVSAPMTGRRTTILRTVLPSETYITCAEANKEMAKLTAPELPEIIAVMGNASVASRDLKLSRNLRN